MGITRTLFSGAALFQRRFLTLNMARLGEQRSSKNGYNPEDREFSLSRSLEEKRKVYKCKDKFVTLTDIPSWISTVSKTTDGAGGENLIGNKISLWRGDITKLEIDAITNAANNSLLGGGGVDGAIHAAAGPKLVAECHTLNGCDTGKAKITAGYNLPAKYVIHTVGPVGMKPVALESCYKSCLRLMKEFKLKSIAFPCISTGIYGYPNGEACHVALETVKTFLTEDDYGKEIQRVIFCLFLEKDVECYNQTVKKYFLE